MKRPQEINLYPLDFKKDEDGGMWCYIPKWLVRAYRLNNNAMNGGRIKIIIKEKWRPMYEYMHEEDCKTEYFLKNWNKKLNRERRKKSKEDGK